MKNNEEEDRDSIQTADLKLYGATCPSCAHAIRHVGGKISGVKNIDVDPVDKIIHIEYTGDGKAVSDVQELVSKLGYHAEPENEF